MEWTEGKNIIEDFNNGSEKAFRWLYDEYFSILRYYGLRYINDVQEIDDIIQDVFIKIWEKKKKFTSLASLRSYMLMAIRNGCLNKIRHLNIREKKIANIKREETEESVLEKLVKLDVFDQLKHSFDKLPPTMKKVYLLSLNGFSHEEISQKLNISVNTIKTHKRRANALLKKDLKDLFSLLIALV